MAFVMVPTTIFAAVSNTTGSKQQYMLDMGQNILASEWRFTGSGQMSDVVFYNSSMGITTRVYGNIPLPASHNLGGGPAYSNYNVRYIVFSLENGARLNDVNFYTRAMVGSETTYTLVATGSTFSLVTLVTPTGLTGTAGDGKVTLNWNSLGAGTSYKVYMDGTLKLTVATNTATITGLTNGTTYKFSVAATNPFTDSAQTAQIALIPEGLPPPSPPTGLSGTAGDGQVDVRWNNVPAATSYKVYVDNVFKLSVATNSARITGLTNGTQVAITVTTVNSAGVESAKSNAISLKPTAPPPPTPPAVPVLEGRPGNKQAVLSWTRGTETDLAGYRLYQDGVKVGTYTSITATVSGLTNGTNYVYQVTAYNTAGLESAKSNSITIKPSASISVTLIPNGDSIVVQISGGSGPYVIDWGAARKTVTQTQYLIEGLQFDTEYTVTVTDANAVTYTRTINTGKDKGFIPPTFPSPQELFQRMLDMFGTAGTIALAIIGGAIALGIMVVLARWAWRLLKNWLSRAK